jgi:hypothetical protein
MLKTIKISPTAFKLLKQQAAREGRFLWKVIDDSLFDYLKKKAEQEPLRQLVAQNRKILGLKP